MRSNIYNPFLLVLLFLVSGKLTAQKHEPGDDVPGIELSCVLSDDGRHLANYSMIVYCDGVPQDTFLVEKPKPVYFRLAYGHNYAIRHIAEGYRDRIVMVNTIVDVKTSQKKHTFDYQIEMIRENEPANTWNDLPVALICYDAKHKKFDYSRKYNDQVRDPHPCVAGND